jgi:plastocyanin
MNRRAYLAALGGAGTAGLAGCLGDVVSANAPCDGRACDVGMSGSAFLPREITVSVGETVKWRNTSARAHTVTAYESGIPEDATYFASGGYDSEQAARDAWNGSKGAIESDETWEHTFEVAGTYEYFCIPHEVGEMLGTVVVEASEDGE